MSKTMLFLLIAILLLCVQLSMTFQLERSFSIRNIERLTSSGSLLFLNRNSVRNGANCVINSAKRKTVIYATEGEEEGTFSDEDQKEKKTAAAFFLSYCEEKKREIEEAEEIEEREEREEEEIERLEREGEKGIREESNLPKCYVIISNLQSGSNIGSICRNCLAFNVHEVIVVGRRNFRDRMRQADRGAKQRQTFVQFDSIAGAAVYLKETKKASIVGVEIMDTAVSLTSLPFTQNTAFMFGNESGGLSDRQRAICDTFTYIPQYAEGG
jgi:tRNA G18 (ribose-2'-O)-methylase SpoU